MKHVAGVVKLSVRRWLYNTYGRSLQCRCQKFSTQEKSLGLRTVSWKHDKPFFVVLLDKERENNQGWRDLE